MANTNKNFFKFFWSLIILSSLTTVDAYAEVDVNKIILSESEQRAFEEIAFIKKEGKYLLPHLYRWEVEQRIGFKFSEGSDASKNKFAMEEFTKTYERLRANSAIGKVNFSNPIKNTVILMVQNIYSDELELHFDILREIFPKNLSNEFIADYINLQKKTGNSCYSYANLKEGKSIAGAIIVITARASRAAIRRCINLEFARNLGLFWVTNVQGVESIFSIGIPYDTLQETDFKFLKLLYGNALRTGMKIEDARRVLMSDE